MRQLLVCTALLIATIVSSIASAEPRRTTESVTLRKKPGEREAAVVTVPANTVVTVIAEEGRWLKVKVNGAVGYVTRTTITAPAPGDEAPPSASWSSQRQGDALFIEVLRAGTLAAEPKPSAAKISDVEKGAHLVVLDATTPGWIHARDDQGREGWISRAQVENGATGVTMTGADLQGTAETYVRPTSAPLAIRAEVGLGYRSLGMDLTSNAEGGLTNYLVDADAVAAVLDVGATYRLEGFFVGGDVRAAFSEASPGIDYPGPTGKPGKIPFSTFAADVGVRAGIHVHDAIDLALRAGGHYDAFITEVVTNVGMLPRERLLGATLGLRADIAPPHSRFGATVRFDLLVVGSRAQTSGLEDGTDSSAHALWGGLAVRYQLSTHVSPFAAYDFGRATTSWTGPSVREPGVTEAHRVDTTQLVQIGVSAEL
jgi:SH3-like domain-containing protein